jgi:toxin ParE1/3/4
MTFAIFDPDARAEFLDAVRYYEEWQEGLGRRFRIAIETAVRHILKNPFLYRKLKAPFRRYLLHKFPYSLIFSIEHDHIHVIAVAHNKRKPGYWRKRITGSSET